jgi:hypothetical protein
MKNHINTQLQLMAIAVFFVLITGLSAIYLMDAVQRSENTSNQRQQELLLAAFEIEEAHTQFKIQVQEWKNLLLRGKNPSDYQHYLASFTQQTDEVQQHLAKAKFEFKEDWARKFDELNNSHKRLVETYLTEQSKTKFADPSSVQALDNSLRGIDRPMDILFPELTKHLTELVKNRLIEDNHIHAAAHLEHIGWIIFCVSISIFLIITLYWISFKKTYHQKIK